MTDIRPLGNADYPAVLTLLQQHANTSLFMLGNLQQAGLEYSGERYQGEFVGAFAEDKLIALVVQYWNGIVHAQGDAAAVSDIWAGMSSGLRDVKGFVGRNDLCLRLKQAFELEQSQVRFALESTEWLYELELAKMTAPALLQQNNVHSRLVTSDDRDLLIPWMIDYNVEALNAANNAALQAEVVDSVANKIDAGATYLLIVDDQPVATTSFNAMSNPHVQVGGVWTPVAQRSKGYARAAVASSLQHAMSLGYKHSVLFTDGDNPAAQKAYESLGYRHVGEFGLYLVGD